MRVISPLALCLCLLPLIADAQLAPRQATIETMDDPAENWFISKTRNGAYVYNGMDGQMQGLLSLSSYTPAVQVNRQRKEFYAAESYFSRGVHGERTDILAIYDFENLSPIAEVAIPEKIAAATIRNYIQLMGDGRHVGVFNMTPAASVTIVDVVDREFASEISTPGCAMMLAVDDDGFLMICGDGTMQLIRLDADGDEASRSRSAEFFSVDDDAVFDRPVPFAGGWLMVSHNGLVYHATVNGNDIAISEPWPMLSAEDIEENWRPGGFQMKSAHEGTGLLYVLMHQGGIDTHHEPGTEIWVYNIGAGRRLARVPLEVETGNIMVTQEAEPLLIIADGEGGLHLYDALELTWVRTIEDPGPGTRLLQDL